ncbi:hypothetical protein CAEBREN_23261 [Caenorhabditis brenneri]|uniref:Uncharacterized protein n=1 Tax=Caenorhabditis brenneri TaxID=135651 RepID=G0MBT8_CAEBE|nr:hypothetical protein CAEBREN_23261 [Caenorhabditis brenneri]
MENRNGRRNSILKTRVTVDVLSETVDNNVPAGPAQNRRVSFHNVKQIQEYDRHHGQMIEGTPIKEKITDTLGSDGILTPCGGHMDVTNMLEHNSTFQVFNNGGADMSLETTVAGGEEENHHDQTAHLLNVTRDKTVYYEEVVETTKTTKSKITKICGSSAGGASDDTMTLFNQTNLEEVDMSMDRPANDTMALFNQTNSDEVDMDMSQSATFAVPRMPRHQNKTLNRTLPMDLEEEEEESQMKKANETMNLFNVSNLENTDMDISNHPAQNSILQAHNDTISMFRSPAAKKQVFQKQVEMDIYQAQEPEEIGSEAMDISQAPPTPSHVTKNATLAMFEDDDDNMDITQNTTIIKETTVEKINENCHMDISSVTVTNPDVQSQTMALFESGASPAREKMAVPTAISSPKDEDQSADATLKMFQSPARQAGVEMKMPTSTQKTMVFEESMDVEESTIHVESPKSPASEEQLATETTESSESPGSPESSQIQDSESTFHKSLNENSIMLEQSLVEEERAAVLQNSMMEVLPRDEQEEELVDVRKEEAMEQDSMDVSMDISHQKTPQRSMHRPKSVQDASTIQNETSANLVEEEERKNESMVKTMQILTDTADVTHTIQEEETLKNRTSGHSDGQTEELQVKSTELGEEVTIQMAMEESVAQNQSQMSFNESYSIRNTSRRRRSLLRDTLVRESPRRLALENSMHISIHMPNHYEKEDGRLTALAEYRQNKSLLNASQEQMMNESGSNLSMTTGAAASPGNGTRDIFAMNASIRSPRNTTINKSIDLNTPRVPSPISKDQSMVIPPESPFQPMPIYDPAVVNVLYLTADDGTAHPEATDFQKALMVEKLGLEKIQEVTIQNSNLTKRDVRDLMLLAREEAEIQFLEFRLKFAMEQSQKQTRCIEELTSENSKMAEQIRDAQNLPEIKKEIEKLRIETTRYTKTEVHQIRQEYMYWRKKMFDAQMAALKHNYEVGRAIADQRAELRMEVEQLEERAAQIKEKNRQERRELVDQILKIMEEW